LLSCPKYIILIKNRAVIGNNNILVSNPDISNPVAVRYAWSDTASATLFNTAGLPASSFRTDDWEIEEVVSKK